MAYWLSNTSTLLFLLQQTLKATGSTPPKPPQPTSLFGRMTQVKRSLLLSLSLSQIDSFICMNWLSYSMLYSSVIWNETTSLSLIDESFNVRLIFFLEFPFILFYHQCFYWWSWWRTSSWRQVPGFAFQATTYCICWKDLWYYSR